MAWSIVTPCTAPVRDLVDQSQRGHGPCHPAQGPIGERFRLRRPKVLSGKEAAPACRASPARFRHPAEGRRDEARIGLGAGQGDGFQVAIHGAPLAASSLARLSGPPRFVWAKRYFPFPTRRIGGAARLPPGRLYRRRVTCTLPRENPYPCKAAAASPAEKGSRRFSASTASRIASKIVMDLAPRHFRLVVQHRPCHRNSS